MFYNLIIPQISKGGIDMGYKEKIIDAVNNISDERILKYLFNFITHFMQKYK